MPYLDMYAYSIIAALTLISVILLIWTMIAAIPYIKKAYIQILIAIGLPALSYLFIEFLSSGDFNEFFHIVWIFFLIPVIPIITIICLLLSIRNIIWFLAKKYQEK
jgi:hypothetical protein